MKSALKYYSFWRIVDEGSGSFPDDLPEEQVVQETLQDESVRNGVVTQGPSQEEVLSYQAKLDQ